jgi:hypothetical protein
MTAAAFEYCGRTGVYRMRHSSSEVRSSIKQQILNTVCGKFMCHFVSPKREGYACCKMRVDVVLFYREVLKPTSKVRKRVAHKNVMTCISSEVFILLLNWVNELIYNGYLLQDAVGAWGQRMKRISASVVKGRCFCSFGGILGHTNGVLH